jgi:hypothetical protein
MSERRRARRFSQRLPLRILWINEKGILRERTTETANVSVDGIYFHLDQLVPCGSQVDVVLTLPTTLTKSLPMRVRSFGQVVRVEPFDGLSECGIAIRTDREKQLVREAEEC